MSNRALKKINKEEQLLANLENVANSEEETEQIDLESIHGLLPVKKGGKKKKQKAKVNAFDLLLSEENDSQELDNENLSDHLSDEEIVSVPQPKPKTQKKAKKKAKKPNQTKPKKEEITLEELESEIEKIKKLDENAYKDQNTQISNKNKLQLNQILKVVPKNLDPDQETIRMFGSKIVQNELRNKRYAKLSKKYILATPREFWPRPEHIGLNMEITDTLDGYSFYSFTQNARYREVQRNFYHAVNTHDPNAIMAVSQMQPYHLDSLLMLSEIAKQSGEIATAGEMIERALFSCELAFHPSFNLANGICRLDYNRLENRSFFLALYRHLQFLARKGCWRTCLEFNKLILSLNPVGDPLFSLLTIDYFSLQSREYGYFLDFFNTWMEVYPVDSLPNMVYSRVLAAYHHAKANSENTDLAVEYLTYAIVHFPNLFIKLIEKCGITISHDISLIREHATKYSKSTNGPSKSSLDLLSAIYVERAFSAWKEIDTIEFLQSNITKVLDVFVNLDADHIESYESLWQEDASEEIDLRLSRHTVISEFDNLKQYLPSDILSKPVYMHDPLPPPESVSLYEDYKLIEDLQRNRGNVFGAGLGDAVPQLMDRLMEGFNNLVNQYTQEGRNINEVVENTENPGIIQAIWERFQNLANPMGTAPEDDTTPQEEDDDEEEEEEEEEEQTH